MEYYSTVKKKEFMPFAITRIDLEGIILVEVKSDTVRQILYNFTYMWNLKTKQKNKTETDSYIQKTNLWLPEERGQRMGEIGQRD